MACNLGEIISDLDDIISNLGYGTVNAHTNNAHTINAHIINGRIINGHIINGRMINLPDSCKHTAEKHAVATVTSISDAPTP